MMLDELTDTEYLLLSYVNIYIPLPGRKSDHFLKIISPDQYVQIEVVWRFARPPYHQTICFNGTFPDPSAALLHRPQIHTQHHVE